MLSTEHPLTSELCISNLFIEMIECDEPQKLLDTFVEYIFNYFKNNENKKEIIANFVLKMAGMRGNYIVSFLQGKIDWDIYMKCYNLIDEKGRKLAENIDLNF